MQQSTFTADLKANNAEAGLTDSGSDINLLKNNKKKHFLVFLRYTKNDVNIYYK